MKSSPKLRKTFLIGIGITLLTQKRVEQEIKKLMKEHNISETQAKLLARKALAKGRSYVRDVEKHVRDLEREAIKAARAKKRR